MLPARRRCLKVVRHRDMEAPTGAAWTASPAWTAADSRGMMIPAGYAPGAVILTPGQDTPADWADRREMLPEMAQASRCFVIFAPNPAKTLAKRQILFSKGELIGPSRPRGALQEPEEFRIWPKTRAGAPGSPASAASTMMDPISAAGRRHRRQWEAARPHRCGNPPSSPPAPRSRPW